MKKLLLLTVVFVFAVSGAYADSTAVATGHADAQIVSPISVAEDTHLNFGKWSSPGSAATVVVSAAASPLVTPSGITSVTGSAPSAGAFTVTNDGGLTYSAAVSPASITITDSTNNMTVDTFTLSCTSGCSASTLYVGGTLHVSDHQPAGTYQGTYTLTLTY